MSDHLPECGANDGSMFCICDALRACEQRVFQEQIEGRQHDMVMAYLRGLDAAQEAIRNREDGDFFPWVQVEIALAAIETLRSGSE